MTRYVGAVASETVRAYEWWNEWRPAAGHPCLVFLRSWRTAGAWLPLRTGAGLAAAQGGAGQGGHAGLALCSIQVGMQATLTVPAYCWRRLRYVPIRVPCTPACTQLLCGQGQSASHGLVTLLIGSLHASRIGICSAMDEPGLTAYAAGFSLAPTR